MSWIVNIVDSNDNKVRTDRLYLKKVAFGTVLGDQFLYVFRIRLPIWSILLPSFLSPFFWIPHYQGLSSILYYPFPPISTFHVQIQIDNFDICPISPSLKSLGVTVRLKSMVQSAAEHSMPWQQPYLIYFIALLCLVPS